MEQVDTICAISTAPGRGGIAVARVSGSLAIEITDKIWKGKPLADAASHTAHLGKITAQDGTVLDTAVATVFHGPNSFTGENTVEISTHGSTYIQQQLLMSLTAAGARIAEPGEFTRRAFLNGRLDLAEAEAVADIIASSSKAAHRLAMSQLQGSFSNHIDSLRAKMVDLAALLELELDFSEEDVTFADRNTLRNLSKEIREKVDTMASTYSAGMTLRDGIPVAIIGRPNVGKSRLLNTLLGTDRAIVSDIPGTTRDTVEETTDIDGHLIRFIDTAGIRHTDDTVESLGIERTLNKTSRARVILWLIGPEEDDIEEMYADIAKTRHPESSIIAILSKWDLMDSSCAASRHADEIRRQLPYGISLMPVSSITMEGVETLRKTIVDLAVGSLPSDESMIVTNARHHAALKDASDALKQLIDGMDYGLTPDLLAQHLRQAITALATITGHITSQEILTTIFSRFCIGK